MDSVEQVRLLSENLGKQCGYLIVKNQSHSEQFEIYENSRTRARVIGELEGQEVVMPRLADWLVTALNKNNIDPQVRRRRYVLGWSQSILASEAANRGIRHQPRRRFENRGPPAARGRQVDHVSRRGAEGPG